MANLTVSFTELEQAAARLRAGRESIHGTLDELNRVIQGLVASGFTTDRASGAYQRAYETFTSGARNTIDGLDGLAHFLTTTANALQEVDLQLAARLNA